jgi:hypothetical protein
MSDAAVRDAALQFFYSGFFQALRRYRRAAVAGWTIVAAGSVGVVLGWDFAEPPGLYHLGLCLGAIVAGLALIQGNIAALSSYVRIPFPLPTAREDAEPWQGAVDELRALMKDVDDGGWQEAFAALNRISRMGERYGLPPLEHGGT